MRSMKRDRRGRNVGRLATAYRRRLAVGGGVLAVHLLAATAWAQKHGRIPDDDGGWLQWVVAAGLAVVVLLSAFINAKRSHLT